MQISHDKILYKSVSPFFKFVCKNFWVKEKETFLWPEEVSTDVGHIWILKSHHEHANI